MSTVPRLHVDHPLAEGERITLDSDQSHYLATVMRRAEGDPVRLFNGHDGEWDGVLEAALKREAVLRVEARRRAQTPGSDLHVLFAPLKKTRTDFLVEKSCELGASALRPVFTARTTADRVNTGRLRALAREAAEQTERLDLPDVREPARLAAVLDGWTDAEPGRRLLFCDEDGAGGSGPIAAPALTSLFAAPGVAPGPWAVLIGPEGGFTPAERVALRSCGFVTPVWLGPRILRADTAAVAILTLWQAVLGDWR